MPWLVVLLLIVVTDRALAEESVPLRWARTIEVPHLFEATVLTVPLDSHFYRYTRKGRPDVRLRRENGDAIGFVIQTATEMKSRTARQTWTAEQTSARVDPAAGLQVELTLREKEPFPTGIRIVTPLRDFRQQVKVESSADGTDWTSAAEPTVVFDYSKYVDARNEIIFLNASDRRHFRITIADITAEQESQLVELDRRLRGNEESDRTERTVISRVPFRIDRVEFLRDERKAESGRIRKTKYSVEHFDVMENQNHQTILTFETQREPITDVKILIDAQNFSRSARVEYEVEDTNGRTIWQRYEPGVITRFAIGTVRKDDVELSIPETCAARFRVVVDNQDSPSLSIAGIELAGPIYELTFLASQPEKLQLEYGSPDARAGNFDTAALKAALASGQRPLTASLQPPRELMHLRDQRWMPWNDTRVLLAAIVIATIVLGGVLFRTSVRLSVPAEK
jgi:hypothetical protein